MAKYQKTLAVKNADFSGVQVGQWIKLECGTRGQYLGETTAKTVTVRWQNAAKFSKPDAIKNGILRAYAKQGMHN
jgi:hypothetical protein